MIVMGGIVGSGIFINPYVVAGQDHTPLLILGVWLIGGALAMAGAFIWAELATRMPDSGGQYLYLREAYHPSVAFIYGWVLLLVTQTGGMAAVAVTFARYFREITGLSIGDGPIAAAALLGLTAINCLGVRAGSNVQSAMMLLKSAAIAVLVIVGIAMGGGVIHPLPLLDRPVSLGLLRAIGAAMIPVAFAYGGWQTSTFVAAEMRDPRRDLSRGLVAGVIGVILLYLSVNFVCLRVLSPAGLAASPTPASAVMRVALGERGAEIPGRRHRGLDARFPEPGDTDGAARLLRHGARRAVLRAGRLALAAHRSARRSHRAARRLRHRHRPLATLRSDPELRGVGGFHLLRAYGRGVVRLPPWGCARLARGHLSGAGASIHHSRLRTDLRGNCSQHHRRVSGQQRGGLADSAGGHSRILVLEPAQSAARRAQT